MPINPFNAHIFKSFDPSQGAQGVPSTAVLVSSSHNANSIYMGRGHYKGEILPADLVPSTGVASGTHAGLEVSVSKPEFLCYLKFVWRPLLSGCSIPNSAVPIGTGTGENKVFYAGRVVQNGVQIAGKVEASTGKLYFPYNGVEVIFDKDFEILCFE